MRKLDAELGGADAPAMGNDAGERGLVGVGIEPHAAVGDAAVALDMGGLDHHQRRAGIGQHAEMAEMPIGGAAVVGAVLAHGRDDDAVRKLEIGEPDRREQGAGHEALSACAARVPWASPNGASIVLNVQSN